MTEFRNVAGEHFLNREIFSNRGKNLELSFSADCDKACYYCYLKQFGEKLYPREKQETILHNLELFLHHCCVNNYRFNQVDIFSGEFFNLPYWKEVLDIILSSNFKNYNSIMIPSNFSFVDKGFLDQVCAYKNKFDDRGKRFKLSCSIDGAEDGNTRPYKNKSITNIDNILNAVGILNAGMHPMISPEFLKNYKKNVDFWIDVAIRFNDMPMLLEVRNNFWDEKDIGRFVKFLEYLTEQMYNRLLNKDTEKLSKIFFGKDEEYKKYDCFLLSFPRQEARMSCSFHHTLFLRVSDLSLIPCHRLSYPQFVYGKFVEKDGKLQYTATNLDFHVLATTFNPNSSMPKCANCNIKSFCIKGCMGSQYETNNDPFIPIDSVCALEKAKYRTLHKIAKEYDLYGIYLSDPNISAYEEAWTRYVITLLDELEMEASING